jgi:hypothetical protein
LPDQQAGDIESRGTQRLADADFLGPAFGGEGGKAGQPKATDRRGKSRESGEEPALARLVEIESGDPVIDEAAADRPFRDDFAPCCIDGDKRRGQIGA